METVETVKANHEALIKQWLDTDYNYDAGGLNNCYNWACIKIPNTACHIGLWGVSVGVGGVEIEGEADDGPTFAWLASNNLMWLTNGDVVDDTHNLTFIDLAEWIQNILHDVHANNDKAMVADMRAKYADADKFLITVRKKSADPAYEKISVLAVNTAIDDHNNVVNYDFRETVNNPNIGLALRDNDDDFWNDLKERRASDATRRDRYANIDGWIVPATEYDNFENGYT